MHDDLLTLIDGVRLTPTQRRIARCLLDHGTGAAFLSSAEVAELAGVSQPSVTRFATALGYDGYPALRKAMRSPESNRHTEDGENQLRHAVLGEIDHLGRLAARLGTGSPDHSALLAAGRELALSRPMLVLGLRAAAPLATYFGYFAAKVHPDARVLDYGGSLLGDRLEQARLAGATAVLVMALPRYPREVLDAVHEARSVGLTVVALTDSPVSPVAQAADISLTASAGTRLVFDLHTGPMTLAMALLQVICDATPAISQARLEAFESSAARRGIFLP